MKKTKNLPSLIEKTWTSFVVSFFLRVSPKAETELCKIFISSMTYEFSLQKKQAEDKKVI